VEKSPEEIQAVQAAAGKRTGWSRHRMGKTWGKHIMLSFATL